jgi:DNA invertase Pin-like site-specific DNA recombinase
MTGRVGYARVSTSDQDNKIQLDRLKAAGCQKVFQEKVSGASVGNRPQLARAIQELRKGDELVVAKLDRLGRSTRDVLNLVHQLDGKGCGLRVLEPEFSTSTDTGRILVTVLGMVAEMERKFIRERQAAGIAAAKKKGVYKGRKRQVDVAKVKELFKTMPVADIAKKLGVSRMTVYRALGAGEYFP